jgi:hypothetical protein
VGMKCNNTQTTFNLKICYCFFHMYAMEHTTIHNMFDSICNSICPQEMFGSSLRPTLWWCKCTIPKVQIPSLSLKHLQQLFMELLANPQIQPTLSSDSFTPFDWHASDNYKLKKNTEERIASRSILRPPNESLTHTDDYRS